LPDFVRTYLPENLSFEQLPRRWPEYSAWLVHHLYLQRHLDRRYEDGSFSPLYSKVLEKILPKRDYKTILNTLMDTGLVEGDSSYRRGTGGRKGWSKGYRLTEHYREATFRQHWLHHPELARKLVNRRLEREKKFLPVHRHLQSMLSGIEIVGDFPTVYLPLVTMYCGDFRFAVCEQGRVHTNLTNMRKEYRKNIRWKGRPLWLIDIVSSQPLILALTLRNLARNTHKHSKEGQTAQGKAKKAYVPSLSNPRLRDDAQNFLDQCLSGQFYERLMDLTGKARDKVKQQFFAVAYGGRLDMGTILGQAFRELFPACFEAIYRIKPFQAPRPRKGEPRPPKDPAQGDLARHMQTLESDLVINRVCDRLRTERPDACLLTIHDCLVTTEEHKDYFAGVLEEEFDHTFGVRPALRINSFSEE
jgi:hypothetical protein